jgi:SAM-dependent methyltransferase
VSEPRAADHDAIPYPSQAFAETHPDRLAALAALLGLPPPPVARCRVLELGCNDGANLLPMAAGLPGASFVGVDLAARPVAAGRAAVAALGLTNVALHRLDVMDLPAGWGDFDYVIAHGLYSWVPPAVQERVLAICARHLAPGGLAYVSYAAYPGWHMFGIVRDMLRYATRGVAEPAARARAALALLDRLAEDAPDERNAFGAILSFFAGFIKQRMDDLGEASVGYILHDTLAEVHHPVYLHEFVERATGHGLRYLADADLSVTLLGDLPPTLTDAVGALGATALEREQFLDFFRGRAFRRSLLGRRPAALDREAMLTRLTGLAVSSPARPDGDAPAWARSHLRGDDDSTFVIDQPLGQAAFQALIERWPAALPFGELLALARERAGQPAAADDARRLADLLLRAFATSARLVGLHVHPPTVAVAAGERPVASPMARYEARVGPVVTNLYHQATPLDESRRRLLGLLDGTRDRAALVGELARLAADGRLAQGERGAPAAEAASLDRLLAERLEDDLAWLARAALLAR